MGEERDAKVLLQHQMSNHPVKRQLMLSQSTRESQSEVVIWSSKHRHRTSEFSLAEGAIRMGMSRLQGQELGYDAQSVAIGPARL